MPTTRTLLSATLLALACVAPAADNLIANGSFEDGKAPWWGEGSWEVVKEGAADRVAALRIGGGYVCQDKRVVQGGKRYLVSLRVRCEGAPEGSVYVQASYRGKGVDAGWRGPADANGEAALLVTGGSHDWKDFSVVVEAPAGADQFLLYLRKAGGSAGNAWYDAVSVTATDAPATAGSIGGGKPVVKNPGFEQGKAAWWGEGAWSVEAGQGVDGSAALKLDKGFVCQDKIGVTGRQAYRVSVRIRSEGCAEDTVYVQTSYRGPAVDAGWRGPAQVKLGGRGEPALFVTGGSHGWQEFSTVVAAPPGAQQILVYLRKQDGAGSAWFDQVAVVPSDEKPLTAADVRRAELAAELLPAQAADPAPALAAAVAAAKGQAAPLALAAGGKALAHLHVASTADVVALGAAKELAGYLKDITGADFLPLSHDGNPLAGPLLVIGRDSAVAKAACADVDWEALGADGFVMRSAGSQVVLAGAGARGTLNAVYWFLDRQLGVKWLAPGATVVPKAADLRVPVLAERQVPRFRYREILSHEGQQKPHKAHNLLNGDSHGPSFWPTPPELDCFERDWQNKGGYANFYELLPQKTYAKAHPGWYAGGQLAMMDQELRAEMARVITDRLKAHADYTRIFFNIHDMDWGWDMDPASKAFAAQHGNHPSAPRLDMVIDVANRVRQELPGARFAFNAYHWSFTPPTGMTMPDHVLVFPMTIHVDYSTPLNAGRNAKLGQDIAGWTAIGTNVQVWDHITNWSGYYQPTPNIYPICDSLKWLAGQSGVRGYFAEGSWDTPAAEFAALRVWVMARLLWDPTQDAKALVAEFCRHYYGPAAGPLVAQYIDLMHAKVAASKDVISEKFQVDLKMYDLDFITRADALFAQAEAAVAGDAALLAHVREARLPVDYVILVRRAEYAAAAAAAGSPWKPDTEARLERFRTTLKAVKATQYYQGGGLKALDELLAVERKPSTPPALVANLPAGDWSEIQDLGVNRYDSALITSDPAASDGAAIRMKGSSSTWAVQLKLDKLPEQGEWEVYADVRVEAEAGHEGEPGARVGAAPPMSLFNTEKIGVLSDGAYHLVKVPGGPHRFSADHAKSLYVQAPAQKFITWVWTDRFICVRAKPAAGK
jgi:hypothetical protein